MLPPIVMSGERRCVLNRNFYIRQQGDTFTTVGTAIVEELQTSPVSVEHSGHVIHARPFPQLFQKASGVGIVQITGLSALTLGRPPNKKSASEAAVYVAGSTSNRGDSVESGEFTFTPPSSGDQGHLLTPLSPGRINIMPKKAVSGQQNAASNRLSAGISARHEAARSLALTNMTSDRFNLEFTRPQVADINTARTNMQNLKTREEQQKRLSKTIGAVS